MCRRPAVGRCCPGTGVPVVQGHSMQAKQTAQAALKNLFSQMQADHIKVLLEILSLAPMMSTQDQWALTTLQLHRSAPSRL